MKFFDNSTGIIHDSLVGMWMGQLITSVLLPSPKELVMEDTGISYGQLVCGLSKSQKFCDEVAVVMAGGVDVERAIDKIIKQKKIWKMTPNEFLEAWEL